MKTVHIVGNRPQFIKLSLLYRAWERQDAGRALILHTGQHYSDNMSAIFFEDCQIPAPDYQLNINNQSHGEMIGSMLVALDRVLAAEKPDGVIVYGDTNTTLAGALAARKRNIPLAHVEAGIRTAAADMPEESNRYLADRMAGWNFACTYLGVENLVKEGYREFGNEATGGSGVIDSLVYNTGDLMLDAALVFKEQAIGRSALLQQLGLGQKAFVLATIHRAENQDDPGSLREIVGALNGLHQEVPVVFPVHPKTRRLIDESGISLEVLAIPPIGYLDMLALVQCCEGVITDSGGLCREAYFFRKPSVIVMEHPFWPEILTHGSCLRSGAERNEIREKYLLLRGREGAFRGDLFGDGHAADKIAAVLREVWG